MKSLNCKSAVAFVMALCLIVPIAANIGDTPANVNAIEESSSEDNQFTVDDYGNVNITVGSNTSLKVELSSAPYASMSGAIMYWDNDLSDNVSISWEASADENGDAIIDVDSIPENITSVTLQVYYCAYWDNDSSSMVETSATVVATSPYTPQTEETTTETTTSQSTITKDEYGNIHISMDNADSIKIEILSHAWAGCSGAVGYWNNSTSAWETIVWSVDNCDENGKAIVDITGIPTDVTDIQFQVYYCAYWDNDTSSMVDTSLEVVNATPYVKSAEETTTEETTTEETTTEETTTEETTTEETTTEETTTEETTTEETTTEETTTEETTTEETTTEETTTEETTTEETITEETTTQETTTEETTTEETTTSVETTITSKEEDTTTTPKTSTVIVLGDINGDGAVKSNDLLLLKKYLLGLEDLDAQALANADLTGDTQVKSNDLLALKKHLLGLD